MGSLPYSDMLALNDDEVMRELIAGNTDAFAVIFRRYHRLVHVTALRIIRDAAEAEDLTQSIFLEVYRKARQFDPARGALKVWLLQFAYSRSMSRRNYILVRQLHLQGLAASSDQTQTLWSPTRLPSQETVRLTSEILNGLPEPQQQTITMFFFQGMTLKEIAERRNETFSNVRHHYYRGLEKLRGLLEEGGARGSSSKESVVSMGEIRRAET
jgi:RNA polymerase sigma-70 factor (ECF subfamily)